MSQKAHLSLFGYEPSKFGDHLFVGQGADVGECLDFLCIRGKRSTERTSCYLGMCCSHSVFAFVGRMIRLYGE